MAPGCADARPLPGSVASTALACSDAPRQPPQQQALLCWLSVPERAALVPPTAESARAPRDRPGGGNIDLARAALRRPGVCVRDAEARMQERAIRGLLDICRAAGRCNRARSIICGVSR